MTPPIPFLRPNPPRLSDALDQLRALEDSGVFSNFGPVNTNFERRIVETCFGGVGAALTVCNATIGLMLAIRACMREGPGRRYALMPSFTFAATAHAAIWAGLEPLFCDIDPQTWLPCAASEDELIRRHRDGIAVIVPYATFGAVLDLDRYRALAEAGLPVVVDAAASLGTVTRDGQGFGAGCPLPVIFSMHVTKTFAATEGGLIYSADPALIERLRVMSNFGFGEPRSATMPGLNGKLSEIGALYALLKLDGLEAVVARRAALHAEYIRQCPGLDFQHPTAARQAHQFVPALFRPGDGERAGEVRAAMRAAGIGVANYFMPHLAEQPYFAGFAARAELPVTRDVSRRCLSLPLFDGMSEAELGRVCEMLDSALRHHRG